VSLKDNLSSDKSHSKIHISFCKRLTAKHVTSWFVSTCSSDTENLVQCFRSRFHSSRFEFLERISDIWFYSIVHWEYMLVLNTIIIFNFVNMFTSSAAPADIHTFATTERLITTWRTALR